jgi:hypothetical protein
MQRPGTGHIERLPSGSYRVRVYAGTDPLTGRRLRYRQTVRTERQAQIVLGRLLEQAEEGQRPDTDVTVADVLARYMAVAEDSQAGKGVGLWVPRCWSGIAALAGWLPGERVRGGEPAAELVVKVSGCGDADAVGE